jgi:hypothetical protein
MGLQEGQDFRDAVVRFAQSSPAFAQYFDAQRLTYWGCRLFPTEHQARQSFG